MFAKTKIQQNEIITPKMTSIISVKNVCKSFNLIKHKKWVLNDVSFNVTPGTIHGFIGPNGSGKTTTIKILVGAVFATSGEVRIGTELAGSTAAKKKIGYVPESGRFPKNLNLTQYLTMMGLLSGLKMKNVKTYIVQALEEYKLSDFAKKNPNDFSSGMKKKVLLIQALFNNPELLILDEPAANLDPSSRNELFQQLEKLRDQGKTIFISSHILSELQQWVDEITILNLGVLKYNGKFQVFDNHNYILKTNDNEKCFKALQHEKLKVKQVGEEIMLYLKTETDLRQVFNIIQHNHCYLLYLTPHLKTLDDVYNEKIAEPIK